MIWKCNIAFLFEEKMSAIFEYNCTEFAVWNNGGEIENYEITEQEFIELLKNEIMDTYNEHSPLHPANIEEIECTPQTELEEQQDWNQELLAKIEKTKELIKEYQEYPTYLLIQLKKLYKL